MRKSLLISAAAIAVLAGALWVISSGRTSNIAEAPAAPSARPAEAMYAPAKLLTASLTFEGVLRLTGTGTPKSTLRVLAGADIAGTLKTGVDTAWEISIKLPPARIARRVNVLSLISELSDGTVIRSEENVVILTEPANFSQALLTTMPGAATQVLQSPFGGFLTQNGLTLEAADFDDAGGIIFSGKTERAGRIRLQAGRSVIGETGPDASGQWALIAGSILPVGSYLVRLQHIDANNAVDAQIDVPFTRPAPASSADTALSSQPAEADETPAVSALPKASASFGPGRWMLTRPLSGGGWQHTVLYSPDLIASEGLTAQE